MQNGMMRYDRHAYGFFFFRKVHIFMFCLDIVVAYFRSFWVTEASFPAYTCTGTLLLVVFVFFQYKL